MLENLWEKIKENFAQIMRKVNEILSKIWENYRRINCFQVFKIWGKHLLKIKDKLSKFLKIGDLLMIKLGLYQTSWKHFEVLNVNIDEFIRIFDASSRAVARPSTVGGWQRGQ